MAKQRFIAILRTGTGDEQRHRERPLRARQRERAGKLDAGLLVLDHDLFFAVGVGTFGFLRPVDDGLPVHKFQDQWERSPALLPVALYLRAVFFERAFKGRPALLEFQPHCLFLEADLVKGDSLGALVWAVQRTGIAAVGLLGDVDDQAQFERADLKGALPNAQDAPGSRFFSLRLVCVEQSCME